MPIPIVLVEDNRADVLLVNKALEQHGVNATLRVIDNGQTALEYIDDVEQGREPGPALMIIDLNLPRRSGKEVLVYLRQFEKCSNVRVLIVTSSDLDRDEMNRLGGNDYFRKPTDFDEFMKVGGVCKKILGLD